MPAVVEFVDIAGLVKGASEGEGLGNQFLANIREVDAIVHVVRCFEDDDVQHVMGAVDPVRDREIINIELGLADLASVEKRLDKTARDRQVRRRAGQAGAAAARSRCATRSPPGSPRARGRADRRGSAGLSRRSTCSPPSRCSTPPTSPRTRSPRATRTSRRSAAALDARTARPPRSSPSPPRSRPSWPSWRRRTGRSSSSRSASTESGLDRLAHAAYHLLGLQSYFTAGEKEVRAWTIHRGDKAPAAAGVIHSDFEKGFIRAETVAYDDFVRVGGWKPAREQGLARAEGKEYVVQDGDVMLFRFLSRRCHPERSEGDHIEHGPFTSFRVTSTLSRCA